MTSVPEPYGGHPRTLTLLGSTGSIGTQAVDVVLRNRDRFTVTGLAAGGSDLAGLARQVATLGTVTTVALPDPDQRERFRAALLAAREVAAGEWVAGEGAAREQGAGGSAPRALQPDVELLCGPEAASELAARPADTVLNGMAGAAGLRPTLAALGAGRTLALANKESLIIGGPLVKALWARPDQVVPVDSEHSALAQCLAAWRLRGSPPAELRRLVITASGGPFRGYSREQLRDVTPAQALNHPTWTMGPLVTINSATLVNKGLEVIEAHLLFDVAFDAIEVMVHPQSVVHSMVEYSDGSTIAQCSPPDMRLAIALGIGWPDRVPNAAPGIDWTSASHWDFYPLDRAAFPAVDLAMAAGAAGGTAPAVYNGADEKCVAAFLAGRLRFTGIVDVVERVLGEHLSGTSETAVTSVEQVLEADAWARRRAGELIASLSGGAVAVATGGAVTVATGVVAVASGFGGEELSRS